MATLSVTIPDAVVPRIQAAFGHLDPITHLLVLATVADVQAAIKTHLKNRVTDFEASNSAETTRTSVDAEAW